MGGLVERIVPRNQTIPTAMAQDFTTYQDGQTALALHVVQGERDLVADCRSLARFDLARHSADGRGRGAHPRHLHGRCRRPAERERQGAGAAAWKPASTVKPSYGLSDDQIATMLQESFSTAQQDMQARALVEARVDADRMLLATKSALDADGDLLDDAGARAPSTRRWSALRVGAQGQRRGRDRGRDQGAGRRSPKPSPRSA